MSDIWSQLLSIVRPNGAVSSILAIFCVYLMTQLERERKGRAKDHADMLELLDRMLTRI